MTDTKTEMNIDEVVEEVAEKALDEFTYKDKTIREWVELMVTAESVVEVRMVEKLEKIKAEMDNKGWYNKHDREQFVKIVDKHIEELKGENKC